MKHIVRFRTQCEITTVPVWRIRDFSTFFVLAGGIRSVRLLQRVLLESARTWADVFSGLSKSQEDDISAVSMMVRGVAITAAPSFNGPFV